MAHSQRRDTMHHHFGRLNLFSGYTRVLAATKRCRSARYPHFDILEKRELLSTIAALNNAPEAIDNAGDMLLGGPFIQESNGKLVIIPSLGGGQSNAYGINDLGQVTGIGQTAGGAEEAFIYDNSTGKITGIETPPGPFNTIPDAVGLAINDSDQVVGYSTPGNNPTAFIYNNNGQFTYFKNKNDAYDRYVDAVGINNSGQTVGYGYFDDGDFPFLYSGGTLSELKGLVWPSYPYDNGLDTTNLYINNSGAIAGVGMSGNGQLHAFLYSGGAYTDLGTLQGTTTSIPGGMNNLGQIVGTTYHSYTDGVGDQNSQAFLYSGGKMVDLDTLLPANSGWTSLQTAIGINDHDQVIGFGTYEGISGEPYLLTLDTVPLLDLTEATTTNAQSVTIDYTIADAVITQPLTFNVYRSDQPTLDSNSISLGEQTLDPSTSSADLTTGNHVVQLLNGTSLPPNQKLPYIIVIADQTNTVTEDSASVNTSYFRTYLLGAIAHGFPFQASNATPAWETQMANDLITKDDYDFAIPFNWVAMGRLPEPGQAVAAGDLLYQQVVADADKLAATHVGDVVDLDFIGHSRGAAVVSRALEDLVGTTDPALAGSYIKLTLLDPHPANAGTVTLDSFNLVGSGIVLPIYAATSTADNDPQIVIPSNVKYAELFYQHSSFVDFVFSDPSEFILNLWGEGPANGIVNQSAGPVVVRDLSNVVDSTPVPDLNGSPGKPLGAIGHSEMTEWYELHFVDIGLAAFTGGTDNWNSAMDAVAVGAISVAPRQPVGPLVVSQTSVSNGEAAITSPDSHDSNFVVPSAISNSVDRIRSDKRFIFAARRSVHGKRHAAEQWPVDDKVAKPYRI